MLAEPPSAVSSGPITPVTCGYSFCPHGSDFSPEATCKPQADWSTAHLPQAHPGPEQHGNLAPGALWRPLCPWVFSQPLHPLSALYPQPSPSSASTPASQLTFPSVTLKELCSFGISPFCSVLNHIRTLPFPWVFRTSAPFLCSVAPFVGPFLPGPLHLGKEAPPGVLGPLPRWCWSNPSR